MRLVAAVFAVFLLVFAAMASHGCERAGQAQAAAAADPGDEACSRAVAWSPDSQTDQDDRGEAMTGEAADVRLPVLPQARADALTRGVPSPWLPGLLRPPRHG